MLENKLNQEDIKEIKPSRETDPVRRAITYGLIALAIGTVAVSAYNLQTSPVEIPKIKELTIRPY